MEYQPTIFNHVEIEVYTITKSSLYQEIKGGSSFQNQITKPTIRHVKKNLHIKRLQ